MTTTPDLFDALKTQGQDFEFYPTTNEIIAALAADIRRNLDRCNDYERSLKHASILDVGAGNGKVLMALHAEDFGFSELYAIEKSPILCGQLDPSIFIVGTAFEEQSLLSKQVDVVFSNPPYSEFIPWTVKLIREAAAHTVYLVIPQRWRDSLEITAALAYRGTKAHVVGEFDFLNAEDRAARAKVHLLRIELSKNKDAAFERFFAEQFAPMIKRYDEDAPRIADGEDDAERPKGGGRHRPFHKLQPGPDYPAQMVQLYNQELASIQRNYELVAQLDTDLLREFDISPARIMACLKQRLDGLKNAYWHQLFSRMRSVCDRLTSKSRAALLDTLHKQVHVDFTVANISAVIVWVIKNANRYMDAQLVTAFESMVEKANVYLYKSNQKPFMFDRWRYNDSKDKSTHFALEYRIVMWSCGGLNVSSYSWDRRHNNLEERAHEFLRDLITIANNLGFPGTTNPPELSEGGPQWESNEKHTFYFTDPTTGKKEVLYEARAFKNRNMHLRLSQRLALALNVEYGRLKGWLKSGPEAAEELNDDTAAQHFKANHQLSLAAPLLTLCAA